MIRVTAFTAAFVLLVVGTLTAYPSWQTQADEKVYEAKEVDVRAKILSKHEPSYTEPARRHKTKGRVILKMVLRSSGEVTDIVAEEELPDGLTEECIRVAREIKFEPAIKDGVKVSQYLKAEYFFDVY